MNSASNQSRFQRFIAWIAEQAKRPFRAAQDDDGIEHLIKQAMQRARQRLLMADRTPQPIEIEPCELHDEAAGEGFRLLTHLQTHLPRCIAGLGTRPVRLKGAAWDGHASPSEAANAMAKVKIEGVQHVNVVFWLLCSCGCNSHFVLGHYWRNDGNTLLFASPLALRCSECGRVTEVLDTDIHGYDAEIGAITANYRGKGKRSEFACERCGPRAFQVFTRFEYPDDVLQKTDARFHGREQDLFTWFTMLGKCTNCGSLMEIADFECA